MFAHVRANIFPELDALQFEEEEEGPSYLSDMNKVPDFIDEPPVEMSEVRCSVLRYNSLLIHALLADTHSRSCEGYKLDVTTFLLRSRTLGIDWVYMYCNTRIWTRCVRKIPQPYLRASPLSANQSSVFLVSSVEAIFTIVDLLWVSIQKVR